MQRLPITRVMLAFVLLVALDAALRVLPFRWVLALVRLSSGRGSSRIGSPPPDIPAAVEAAGRLLPWAQCLPRSLACHVLVRRAGFACAVMLGVARDGTRDIVAHAWPESAGQALIGPYTGDFTYTRLPPLDL